jgi:orotidine-5'-phosphate decarboxylase
VGFQVKRQDSTFYRKLRTIQRRNNSLLCIGLDTDINKVPGFLKKYADPVYEFNRSIIAGTKDLVCAFKLNLAFYESLGWRGWRVIRRTLSCIPRQVVTIADAKRGDIGNSAERYAEALFDEQGFDAATVNPYMGTDCVEPFLTSRRHGAFVLAVTSNRGARDFQYLGVRGKPLFEHVVLKAREWNTKRNCGLVAGATQAKQLRRVRALSPGMPLLIPGIGAQKGDLGSAVRFGCDANGEMAIISASRSIIYASGRTDFVEAARSAACLLRDEINAYRHRYFPQ